MDNLEALYRRMPPKDHLFEIRHSAAHIMAAAVLKLFPGSKLGTGPATAEGFFYDIQTPRPLNNKDLPAIEKEMRRLITGKLPFTCTRHSVDEALKKARAAGQPHKEQLIMQLKAEGETEVSYYQTGNVFEDLCAGPHVDNAHKIGAFKLLSVAGAYWRGDENNPQMSRIYGTAFETQEQLDNFLKMREEAKKRDHKKLGLELDLFTWSDLVGPGLPLFTPRGTVMLNVLDEFVWQLRRAHGYQRVAIPHITKRALYEKSGHWEKFKDELFKIKSREGHEFALKPMNCPHHTQIFSRRPHSYRELPVRYADTTTCYRDEQTGELAGLTRTRAFTQDDAHVFARSSQIRQEVGIIWEIIETFYGAIGMKPRVRLSLSDPKHPEKYLGKRETWDHAESELRLVAHAKKVEPEEVLGEAAFYGPKLDFMAKDSLGRETQVATIQLDMQMPERFDLVCIDEAGQKERIVMIHAAIMGSIERFLSVAIEHYNGAFPVWMAPVQVSVIPVSQKQAEPAHSVAQRLSDENIRVEILDGNETLGKRIRRAEKLKVPYVAVIGSKEAEAGTVAVRQRGKGDMGALSVDAFAKKVLQEEHDKT